MSSEDISEYTHEGSINSVLTDHGRKPFTPLLSKYVCHTSTIPLATTLDMEYARKLSSVTSVKSLFHGHTLEKPISRCGIRSCMFTKRDNSRTNQHVLSNCPCLEVQLEDGSELEPICFLAFLKSLNRNLINPGKEDVEKYINADRVMFCQDSQGIFDNRYPGAIKDVLGVSGWGHTSAQNICEVMDYLYWFRKSPIKDSTEKLMRKVFMRIGIEGLRRAIKQSLHTLNGLMCKKFFVFGPEISSYTCIAEQTARLFHALLDEYGHNPSEEYSSPVFQEMKDLFNFTKSIFYKGDIVDRTSWLLWDFKHKDLKFFFTKEFAALYKTIDLLKRNSNMDYTDSLAWFFRSTTFAQTRNLGYLPPHMAEKAFADFRDTISRPVEALSTENDKLIRLAVIQRLKDSEITYKFLEEPSTEAERQIADDVLSNISLDLKGSASVNNMVAEGGKLEDARLAINMIQDNNWTVPIRSLKTNEIVGNIGYDTSDTEAQWNNLLFWFSYQLALNWCAMRGLVPEDLYYPFPQKGKEEEDYNIDILEASIVHIMEPGKIRDLVKGTGYLTWVLTPAAKILQAALALLPEHHAGLELASHDWTHARRISSESTESGFIYLKDGTVKQNVLQVFKDWKQSTDFISKRVGAAHLTAFAQYIGFPPAYLRILLILIREPQPVREVVTMRYHEEGIDDGTFKIEKVAWSGKITEGYMMGLPVTKPILHLIHVSEREVVKMFLKKERLKIGPGDRGPPQQTLHVHMPRDSPRSKVTRL